MIFSLMLGGITHHFLAPNLNYCNSINDVGTIANEYVVGMAGTEDFKVGFIKGKDSACGNITGAISSINLYENVDFMIGGYNTNFQEFKQIGVEPPSINGITPILGLNFKIPVYKTENTRVSIDNLVSIGIVTHAISFTF